MSDFLPFIVIGISVGAIYGLAGTGLVLTYKTSGIFNFALRRVGDGVGLRLLLAPRAARRGRGRSPAFVCVFVLGAVHGHPAGAARAAAHARSITRCRSSSTVGLVAVGRRGRRHLVRATSTGSFPPFLPTSTRRDRRASTCSGSRSSSRSSPLVATVGALRLPPASRGSASRCGPSSTTPTCSSLTGTSPVRGAPHRRGSSARRSPRCRAS